MHELPGELTRSLRSWRGSVYRKSGQHDPIDLEKGQEDYGEKAVHETKSSLILHPTASKQALNNTGARDQYDGQRDENGRPQKPAVSTDIVARRNPKFAPQTPASAKKSVYTAPLVSDPDPAADRLDDETEPLSGQDFYELIGMVAPTPQGHKPKKLAVENGLYGKIHHAYSYINTKYRIFDVMTYFLLILQIFLSAVFIVLGSLARVDSHIAIAVLGAVSTVVAGALALMKGQGLPNRLRQSRDSLMNVIFEVEELYWDKNAGREVYYRDIRRLREDFLRVMTNIQKNHPDTWNATSSDLARAKTKARSARGGTAAGAPAAPSRR